MTINQITDNVNQTKISSQNLELYKEDDNYYLRMDFEYENDSGYYKGHVDKIKFNFLLKGIEFTEEYGVGKSGKVEFIKPSGCCHNTISFDIAPDEKNNLFTIELIKEKVHEMTIEEIEKRLGHKVKIISKQKGIILWKTST